MHVFDDSHLDTSLISISELCNMGCTATFTASNCIITYQDDVVCTSTKSLSDRLWNIILPSLLPSTNATLLLSSDRNFVLFAHAALGSPAISTLLRAVRLGYLSHWPRLTATLISQFLPHTLPTAQGHLNQQRQGHDSTKTPLFTPLVDNSFDIPHEQLTPAEANRVYVQLHRLPHQLSSDLTGRFPVPSSTGSQYVLVTECDGYIHVEPMSARTTSEYMRAFRLVVKFFASHGRKPFFQKLDNETSATLENFFRAENIQIQYCPPGQHRANIAERSIQTFKNHAIATLATTDPLFPLALWDKLLPQMELCLNHLMPYKLNPHISAHAGLHGGSHDFRSHPIAPAGIKVLIHDKPAARASWAPHGVQGFYLGPALQHYRCFQVYNTATSTTRITDTVQWFPHGFLMPDPSPHDNAVAAIADLSKALQRLAAIPLATRSEQQSSTPHTIVEQLTDLLHMYSPMPPSPPEPLPPPPAPVPLPAAPPPSPSPLTPPRAAHVRFTLPPPKQRVPYAPVFRPHSPPPDQRVPTPSEPMSLPPPTPLPPPDTATSQTHPAISTLSPLNLAPDGSPLTYRKATTGPNAIQWLQAEEEEFDRLIASNTIRPIHRHEQPLDRRGDTTYYNPQTKQKRDALGHTTYRIRGTAGGDKINYTGPTSALTADMPVVKLLLHSVVSDNAHWLTIDIKDYYLNTPLLRPEYVRIPLRMLPPATIKKHNLTPYIIDGTALFQVSKGMYGLPQAGLLAQQRLIEHLATHGYTQTDTPCLFRHSSNGTMFTLVVDDFGVKYTTKDGVQHLITTLQLLYEIKINWAGTTYIGFHIQFTSDNSSVSLSMPGYIAKVLKRFNISPSTFAASPAIYTAPSYGATLQKPAIDLSAPLSSAAAKLLQEQVGCLLYYARSVDSTILPAVTHISSRQASPTDAVAAAMTRLLQYCAKYPDNHLVFHACSMQLEIQSDASYLSRPNSRSVAGSVFYLTPPDLTTTNSPCHALSTIIPVVVASVAEAEYAALFIAGRTGAELRTILTSLGYRQPSTTIYCDNACAVGIATDTVTPRRTKSMDMQFHWIRDRVRQHQFTVTWLKGADNLADFFTKALPAHHHRRLMPSLVCIPSSPNTSLTPHAQRRQNYLLST